MLEAILHAGDRFILHFFAAPGICLSVLFVLQMVLRRTRAGMFFQLREQILLSAVLVFACSTLREAWDVKQGQPLFKAFTDYLSWAGGCGCYAWGLLRICCSK